MSTLEKVLAAMLVVEAGVILFTCMRANRWKAQEALMREQAVALSGQVQEIDRILDRRMALDAFPTRSEKLSHCIKTASNVDSLHREVDRMTIVLKYWQEECEGPTPSLEDFDRKVESLIGGQRLVNLKGDEDESQAVVQPEGSASGAGLRDGASGASAGGYIGLRRGSEDTETGGKGEGKDRDSDQKLRFRGEDEI